MIAVMKWATVIGYWGTAVICALHVFRQNQPVPKIKSGRFWRGAAVGMFLLGVNKQGDLTGLLTNAIRGAAWRDNWFFARHTLQLAAIAGGIAIAFILFFILAWLLRPKRWPQWLALLGIVYLTGFALVRAVSLHAIDYILYASVSGIQLNWIFELGGIAFVVLAASLAFFTGQNLKETPTAVHETL